MNTNTESAARFPLGSVLVVHWGGRTMIVNSFFEVVGHTAKGIKVRAIAGERQDSFVGREMPLKGVWDDGCIFTKGKVRTVLVEKNGQEIRPQIDGETLYAVAEGESFYYYIPI